MFHRGILAHHKDMSEFKRGRSIRFKKASQTISRRFNQSDATNARCWLVWVNNGKYQRQNGTGWLRATVEREDRATDIESVTVPDLTWSTIHYAVCTHVSNITHGTWLSYKNMCSHRLLWRLYLILVHCWVQLECCYPDQGGTALTEDI